MLFEFICLVFESNLLKELYYIDHHPSGLSFHPDGQRSGMEYQGPTSEVKYLFTRYESLPPSLHWCQCTEEVLSCLYSWVLRTEGQVSRTLMRQRGDVRPSYLILL